MGCTRAAVGGLIGILCVVLTVGGCAGNGNGLDANGQPLVAGASGSTPLSADFESLQENIFTPICSVCHVGGGAPQGLRLDAANSYDLLVGVPSTEVPSILRVKPGDPDNSYIIQKLEGHAAVGAQMPLGGPYLPTTTIAFISQWITNGAQPAASSAAVPATVGATTHTVQAISRPARPEAVATWPDDPGHLVVMSTVPAPGDILDHSPPQIMIGFNRAVDITRIDGDSVSIEALSLSDAPTTRRMAARATVPEGNTRVLLLWPSLNLSAGHYRVVVPMNGVDTVTSTFDIGAAP